MDPHSIEYVPACFCIVERVKTRRTPFVPCLGINPSPARPWNEQLPRSTFELLILRFGLTLGSKTAVKLYVFLPDNRLRHTLPRPNITAIPPVAPRIPHQHHHNDPIISTLIWRSRLLHSPPALLPLRTHRLRRETLLPFYPTPTRPCTNPSAGLRTAYLPGRTQRQTACTTHAHASPFSPAVHACAALHAWLALRERWLLRSRRGWACGRRLCGRWKRDSRCRSEQDMGQGELGW